MKPCKICGRTPEIFAYIGKKFVQCGDESCWVGPSKNTEAEAIAAWDKLMGTGPEAVEPGNEVRRPVGIGNTADGEPIAVCDDGSVFIRSGSSWFEMPPIPGTKADK